MTPANNPNSSKAANVDLSSIPLYEDRTFVPEDADLNDVQVVTALYQQLCDRKLDTAEQVENFLHDRSELEAAMDQHGSLLYIRMTCQTDDPARADAFKHFVENIAPAIKPYEQKLDRKYLEAIKYVEHDTERYAVYDRCLRTDVELFREDNIPLQTRDSILVQQYQTISGGMTVEFAGEEKTLPQMTKYLLDTDRSTRESAWRSIADRRLSDCDKIEEIFDEMVTLRQKIAANADCDNFMEYRFKSWHRFDYTPDDCRDFHAAVETCVVPLLQKIYEHRAQKMDLPKLRPWDTRVDAEGKPALSPFDTVEQFIDGIRKMFRKVEPDFADQFQDMADSGLLDLASRKGKAPGGYQCALPEIRKPFIFTNAVGTNDDLRVLLHEGGHAFHSYACRHDPLLAYRHAPLEFCEVASMSMELLAAPHLDVFYDEEQARRSRRDHLEGLIATLASVAVNDLFQQKIYLNPAHTRDQRKQMWLETTDRFDTDQIDWTGLDEAKAYQWHRVPHFFQTPFYYIEYGIAQLGALQIWLQAKADPANALQNYRHALALGGSRSLADLFTAAKINFDFTKSTIAPLMQEVQKELETLWK
ncbi:Oligoendopeptidase F, plasmid [Anaerohalosphaera lusitana]|uniref:Oligoendopeptidase F, plasmid n=1 Tax=Anaerohalosphaera lusitana TaxID=1936003 RepID=A0A1U9NGS8_9BACT|nr:M3 family oligoendopeptidase [Anaerohalosphaera lusitana]AQT67015.1 Oligoendopeptidase F, plasmid [Anaerohalosphaera lusitana]